MSSTIPQEFIEKERIISEAVRDGMRLGRHVLHDRRSRDYKAATASAVTSVQHSATGLPLDQGSIGSCTANAWCGAFNSAPNYPEQQGGVALAVKTETDAVTLYSKETTDEGSPYPPNDPGGSGLAVCKAAVELGWGTGYAHAFGLDDALKALVLQPIIIGIDWYEGFDSPNSDGLVVINGSVRGGHEVVLDGIDADKQLVWAWNSWGAGWGLGGKFCMSFTTLGDLLSSDGDATVPLIGSSPSPVPNEPGTSASLGQLQADAAAIDADRQMIDADQQQLDADSAQLQQDMAPGISGGMNPSPQR